MRDVKIIGLAHTKIPPMILSVRWNPNMEERKMKITITYCVPWNYLPEATSLAAAISDEIGVEAELIEGKGGIFDVVVDGNLIFSKKKTGRFPENKEILEMLRK